MLTTPTDGERAAAATAVSLPSGKRRRRSTSVVRQSEEGPEEREREKGGRRESWKKAKREADLHKRGSLKFSHRRIERRSSVTTISHRVSKNVLGRCRHGALIPPTADVITLQ